jgi:hypothetical protein
MVIAPSFLSADLKIFEAALAAFLSQRDITIDEVIAAIDLLNQDQLLGSTEIARRARLVFGKSVLAGQDTSKFVAAASRWKPAIRHSIQSVLSPELRQQIYSSKSTGSDGKPSSVDSKSSATTNVTQATAEVRAATGDEEIRAGEEEDFRSVLLLGSADAHEANLRFLATSNFSPIRISSQSELNSSLGNGICGIIVDGSWWTVVPPELHEECLRHLLSFSNFVWLKIDHASLKGEVIEKFAALCRDCRFQEPMMTEVGFPMPSRLNQIDIQRLDGAAKHLSSVDRIRFHPSEITEHEAIVLLGAIQKQLVPTDAFTPVEIERVDTSVVAGGQSSAKILLLKPNDNSAPFVAKIDEPSRLNEEMLRFKTFIEPWQKKLKPQLYIHNGVAGIFFALVDDDADQDKRAPTLRDRIDSLNYSERVSNPNGNATLENLQHAVTRAVELLSALNRKKCPSTPIKNSCWVTIEPILALKKNGVNFLIAGANAPIDVLAVFGKAKAQVDKLNGKALCHGDMHSRNILVRLDREPFFIDFAYSGPGHPAFDLVRLEASLLYTHFRMTESEDEITECFHELFAKNLSIEELKKLHPSLLASKMSCLAVHASLRTKQAAIEVLKNYGGGELDYLSMKLVVACQSLVISGFQEGTVRAGIRAICRLLKTN